MIKRKMDTASGAERSLIAFDMLAGLAIVSSPLLFSAIEPVPERASLRALIAFGVIVAAFLALALFTRFHRDETDEFVRRTWERACGFGFGITVAAHLLWSTAEHALLIRPMSSQDVVAVLIIATGAAWFWFRREGSRA